MRRRQKQNHSPTSGDPTCDGNGGTHWSWEHAIARSLGSKSGLCLGAWDTLSWRIWATPRTLAPLFCACPSCKNTPPKTWSSLALPTGARCQTVYSWGRPTLDSPCWQWPSMEWALSTLVCLSYPFLGPITHSHQVLESHPKKVYPWGVPPRVSSRGQSPHVISLHQSVSLMESLNLVARSVRAHSSLISVAIQDGELFTIDCVVLRAHRHADRDVEDSPPPAYGPWVVPCAIPSLHPWRVAGLGQDVPVGPPDRPEIGPWGASSPYGWWVS